MLDTIKIHVRTLATPPSGDSVSVATMIRSMRRVYEQYGILTEVVKEDSLSLPHLEDLEVGGCKKGELKPEQLELFEHRGSAAEKEIVIYIVRSTVDPSAGCASHPEDKPSAVVSHMASVWTLGHEVGHVLGLIHADDTTPALMTAGGTISLPVTRLPKLTDKELKIIRASKYLHKT